jgi:hypothetical protein
MGSINPIDGSIHVEIPLQLTVNNSSKKAIIEGHSNSDAIPMPQAMGALMDAVGAAGGMMPEPIPPATMANIKAKSAAMASTMTTMIATLESEIADATASIDPLSATPPPTFSTPDPSAALAAMKSAAGTMGGLSADIPSVPGLIGMEPFAEAKAIMDSMAANVGGIMAASAEVTNVSAGAAISSPELPTPPAVPTPDAALGPLTDGTMSTLFSAVSTGVDAMTTSLGVSPTIPDMVTTLGEPDIATVTASISSITSAANDMITSVSSMMGPLKDMGNSVGLMSMMSNPAGAASALAAGLPAATAAALANVQAPDISGNVPSLPEIPTADLEL